MKIKLSVVLLSFLKILNLETIGAQSGEGNFPFCAIVEVENLLGTSLIFQNRIWLVFTEILKWTRTQEEGHKHCRLHKLLSQCKIGATILVDFFSPCGITWSVAYWLCFISVSTAECRVRVGLALGFRLRFCTFFFFKSWENLVGIKR